MYINDLKYNYFSLIFLMKYFLFHIYDSLLVTKPKSNFLMFVPTLEALKGKSEFAKDKLYYQTSPTYIP